MLDTRPIRTDKRKAVKMALADPEWGAMTDRIIADKVGVNHETVASVRKQLAETANIKTERAETKRIGKDGKKLTKPVLIRLGGFVQIHRVTREGLITPSENGLPGSLWRTLSRHPFDRQASVSHANSSAPYRACPFPKGER